MTRLTNISRPYIRKLARSVGFQFPRAGIEQRGILCACVHCGILYFRSASKVDRAEQNFCSVPCKNWFQRGVNHPSWKDGDRIRSFSSWVTQQADYKKWREAVLERCGRKCVISGRDYNLEAHHVLAKAESMNMEDVFKVDNGISLNDEVHQRLHQLVSQKVDPIKIFAMLKNEFCTFDDDENDENNENIAPQDDKIAAALVMIKNDQAEDLIKDIE